MDAFEKYIMFFLPFFRSHAYIGAGLFGKQSKKKTKKQKKNKQMGPEAARVWA